MDAIDILGGLLGRKSSGSGGGLPDILRETLRPATSPEPTRPAESRSSAPPSPDIEQQARELEDLQELAHGLRLSGEVRDSWSGAMVRRLDRDSGRLTTIGARRES